MAIFNLRSASLHIARSLLAVRRTALMTSVATLTVAAGCAGTAPSPAAPEPHRAQGSISSLHASIRVITETPTSNLGQQYAAALRWAGVEVVPTIADADVVTELRVRVRKDERSNDVAEVTLDVRGGTEHLAAARVTYPVREQVSKDDLSVLTAALTDSARVRAYADRVALEKSREAHEADEAAWQNAKSTECAKSTRLGDCSDVIRYLNGFPSGGHRAEAEVALQEAEKLRLRTARDEGIERVKADLAAWQRASVEDCRTPQSLNSCDGVTSYVKAFPSGRFAAEATTLLADSQAKLGELREKAALDSAIAQRRSKATARR